MLWTDYNQDKIIKHFIDKYVTKFHRSHKLFFLISVKLFDKKGNNLMKYSI